MNLAFDPAPEAAAVSAQTRPTLRADCLSPTETFAQSLSTIAPTTTPTMTIPLVFALAGNGTWLAYLLAGVAVLLMALTIGRFARYTACSGSLYTYATESLPRWVAGIAGLALLMAYVATGASVAGGFVNYCFVFLDPVLQTAGAAHNAFAVGFALLCCLVSTLIAYRDVQVSARLMLGLEVLSVAMISVVLALLLWHGGLHIDHAQMRLAGVSGSGVRLAVVLALFSFVGFESATTLGAEAVHPLRTIPRAVLQSAVASGIFFCVAAYLLTAGMHSIGQDLGKSTAPLTVLSALVHVPVFGVLINIGTLISMFAATLACISAGARVLLRMATNGLIPRRFAEAHATNATPAAAVLLVGLMMTLPLVVLAARGVAGTDMYGWLGSLAVYGFITIYALAAIALPFYLKRNHHLTVGTIVLSVAAALAMLLAFVGTLYPVPTETPYNWLPLLYFGYIAVGAGWFYWVRRRSVQA